MEKQPELIGSEYMRHLQIAYNEIDLNNKGDKISPEDIARGLPGHWVVTKPDGRRFGKTTLSAEEEEARNNKEDEVDEDGEVTKPAGIHILSVLDTEVYDLCHVEDTAISTEFDDFE